MSGCRDSQKVKYTAGSFVGKALRWWNSQIHTRGREAAVDMVRRRQRRGAGVSRTRASEGESNSIQNGSTINCDTNETSPANVIDNLHNPSLQEGRKPVWISKGLLQRYSKKEMMRQGTLKVSQSTKTFTLEN
uniref:Reverse transcriptase domain-containing protein n=1 Tax=Tanacetum cinerariifolium TaxID=118510 RepID=A0A6L2NFK4_TANCI|nr:hypothetical protein [Tanacetum cinerariifolium]